MSKQQPPKLREIAARITAHLERFERDPIINACDKNYGTKRFYNAHSWASGAYVGVRYISFQCESHLRRAEALAYLEWLDAGRVGRHYEQQDESKVPQ